MNAKNKKEYFRKYYQDNKEDLQRRHKRNRWMRLYGITIEDYEKLLQNQDYCCAICEQPTTDLHIDHDHTTQKVRGLLCHHCNSGLGLFKDSIFRLQSAIRYLEND